MKKLILLFSFILIQNNLLLPAEFELPEEIFRAACSNEIEPIKKYLEAGGNVNAKMYGRSILCIIAGSEKSLDLMKYLVLEKGADVNLQDHDLKTTALIRAAKHDQVEKIKFLLDNKANIEHQGFQGTALICAARECNLKAVQILIEKGANIFAKTKEGQTAFDVALENDENWYKYYKEDKDEIWLKVATRYKMIAKLIFDKFIQQNPDILFGPLGNRNLFNIINGYNLDLTPEEIEMYQKEQEKITDQSA